VSNTQLSVKQFAILALGQSTPPWHLSALLTRYNQKFLALKNTIANLSTKKAVIYVAIATAANVASTVAAMESEDGGTNTSENENSWGNLWSDTTPVAKSDLETLQSILTPVGASIVYLSPYTILTPEQAPGDAYAAAGEAYIPAWVTVGIGGTFAALASIAGQIFPFDPAKWSADDWTALKGLTQGIVVTNAGALWMAAGMINSTQALGIIPLPDVNASVGPTPSSMVVLTGGNSQ
jgi:hypothetical protein